jgi:Zn-dependent M28 family amino/carboxypeptidase
MMLRTSLTVLLLAVALAGCEPAQPEGPTPGSPLFDGAAAFELVERQVAFGPRVPGTSGHKAQAEWMIARLDSLGAEMSVDSFHHVTASGDTLPLVNVLARFRPEAERRLLFLAHWDTRPTSDQAGTPALQAQPVPGANDGASGTAVLLELAGLLAGAPPPMGVDLLFVDGEDYGPGTEDMFLGAIRFAETLSSEGRPVYGVLLDLVGDADPSFPVEAYSIERAPLVVRKVWRAAKRLGFADHFPDRVGERLLDDHLPLNDAGIPTAVIIDFSYGPANAYWHTPEDTPDKVSSATLAMVGAVVVELIYSGG